METCEYEKVKSNVDDSTAIVRRPLLRQLLVISSAWISYFLSGICTGSPTVIIPQLRRESNSTSAVSDEMASWMSSIQNYAGIPWIIVLAVFTERCGRRLPFLFVHLCLLCSFVVIYCSSTVTQILIGESIQGTLQACTIIINALIVSEYSSPKYRGMFFTLKSATFTWGLWISNALGTFLHWKTIPILGFTCTIYCIVSAIIWQESPYWLASKGYFVKCAASHRYLKGTDDNSEMELAALVETQKEVIENSKNNAANVRIKSILFSKDYCKTISICMVLLSLYHFSGKMVCAIYSIDIFKKISNNDFKAYTGMLILDGVSVIGMYMGCALSRYLKRRTLILSASSVGILFLYLISLYLYLIKLLVISENNFVSISLLSVYSLAMCCGPMLMATSIYGELIPLKMRSFSVLLIGFYNQILFSNIVKLSPYLFKCFMLHGAFMFYGVMSTICLLLLFKYLPETKDKTLQEIEDDMKIMKSSSTEEETKIRLNQDRLLTNERLN